VCYIGLKPLASMMTRRRCASCVIVAVTHRSNTPQICSASCSRPLSNSLLLFRDIKPENCLLDSGNVLKLADLGGAVHALPPYDVRHTLCGTPEYLAPEVLAGSGYKAPVDSWACGVLMYELFYGASPFRDRENDRIYANITSFQGLAYHLPVAKRKQLPCDDAYQLMEGLLSVDSGLRFSPDTAASCPWLSSAEC